MGMFIVLSLALAPLRAPPRPATRAGSVRMLTDCDRTTWCRDVEGADGQPPKYTSALDCYFKVKAAEGWTGLYRGLGITLIRGIPNTGIQFLVYETLKDVLDAYG